MTPDEIRAIRERKMERLASGDERDALCDLADERNDLQILSDHDRKQLTLVRAAFRDEIAKRDETIRQLRAAAAESELERVIADAADEWNGMKVRNENPGPESTFLAKRISAAVLSSVRGTE